MKLKVWGGNLFHPSTGNQVRAVVVAATKKRAMELTNLSRSYFDGYWTETGSTREVALLQQGEGLWLYDTVGPRGIDALAKRTP